MLIIKSPSNDAYFNIASEEYILDNFSQDVFLLYINSPSIIVGKYQNTISQLNLDYIREHDVKVVRRLTGGGAVFHDLGNLNFSFICNRTQQHEHSFVRYTEPILSYLHKLGLKAELKGRNDLVINDRKFSGNARLTTSRKVLQHGTILFSARITDLSNALKTDPRKFEDKAVKSVQARVTNISEHLQIPMSVDSFKDGLLQHITSSYSSAEEYELRFKDISRIEYLARNKYTTWAWNFGNSPKYNFNKTIRTKGGSLQIRLEVDNGIIRDFYINGDFFTRTQLDPFIKAFINTPHEESSILSVLEKFPPDNFFIDISSRDILCAML